MDCISTLTQNRQFLNQIGDDKLDQMRGEIIDAMFASTKSLLEYCIHYVFNDMQQTKLNQILVKLVDPVANDNNLSLTCLPDDCLSHTMSFLSIYEKGTIQHCCRSLLIIARKPWSCCDSNNIESNLYGLIGDRIYHKGMKKLMLSDNVDDNLEGITLFNEHIKVNLPAFAHLLILNAFRRNMSSVSLRNAQTLYTQN